MQQSVRTHTTSFVALTLTLTLIGLPSPVGAAEPPAPMLLDDAAPTEAAPQVGLRVNTDDLGGVDEPTKRKIVEVATGVFDAQGFADVSDAKDPRIVIVVERTGDEEHPGFVVGFSIEKGDEVVAGSARQLDCSLCTRTELVEEIGKELPALLELARKHQVPRAVSDGGRNGDDVTGDVTGGGDGEETTVDRRKIGGLGFAGIGVGVVGLAGVGAGVGLVVKGVEPIAPNFYDQRNYRKPGTVILAIGGAALIAGIVMIAVDVSKRKKARRGAAETSTIRPHGSGFAF